MVENYGHTILCFNDIIIITLIANSKKIAGRHIDCKMTINVGNDGVLGIVILLNPATDQWFVVVSKRCTAHLH